MPSIIVRMREEQQIRVRAEFGGKRIKTMVETDRKMAEEFWFVLIGLVVLNRSWHSIFIGWGGFTLVGLVKNLPNLSLRN
jgi:hypothetical protein